MSPAEGLDRHGGQPGVPFLPGAPRPWSLRWERLSEVAPLGQRDRLPPGIVLVVMTRGLGGLIKG